MSRAPLADEHALVTGGATGIGAAVARRLARDGAAVTVLGRNRERLETFASEHGFGAAAGDVTDDDSVHKAFATATSDRGPVSLLVNNAGAAEAVPFRKLSNQIWSATLDVNLSGVFRCTSAAIGPMLERGHGRIVNVASTAALTGYAYVSAYCAAKHGVVGLTRALALEFARKGITVNAVCPGYTDTDIVERSIEKIIEATGRDREAALAEFVSANPQGRLVQPDEVADAVAWLCQPGSASITGQAIAVAGGEVL